MRLQRDINFLARQPFEFITKRPDLSAFTNLDLVVDGTGLDAADGVLSIEESDDGISWTPIATLETTMASGDTSQNKTKGSQAKAKYKIVWTPNSVTQGQIHVCFKGTD